MPPGYLQLAVAIVAEVIATSALKASNAMSNPLPTILVFGGYLISFYMLSIVVKTIPIGIAYAVWAGVGVVLVGLAGAVLYKQMLDAPAIIGMGLIIAGVITLHLFSKTAVLH